MPTIEQIGRLNEILKKSQLGDNRAEAEKILASMLDECAHECLDKDKSVAAERERCAKIAEQADRDPKALSIFQGVEIAERIRNEE